MHHTMCGYRAVKLAKPECVRFHFPSPSSMFFFFAPSLTFCSTLVFIPTSLTSPFLCRPYPFTFPFLPSHSFLKSRLSLPTASPHKSRVKLRQWGLGQNPGRQRMSVVLRAQEMHVVIAIFGYLRQQK